MLKTVLISSLMLASTSIMSQNVSKDWVKFSYKRKPLMIIHENNKDYNLEISIPWSNKNKIANQANLEKYEADLIKADEEYNQKINDQKEKSKSVKLAGIEIASFGGSEDPIRKKYVSKPKKKFVINENEYSNYTGISGFQRSKKAPFTLKIELEDIVIGEVEDFKLKDKEGKPTGKYKRQVKIKQPIIYSIIDSSKKVLFTERWKDSNKQMTISSEEIPAKEWHDFKAKSWQNYYESSLKNTLLLTANSIKEQISYKFGYCKISKDTKIYYGKNKKMNYQDLSLAKIKATRAFQDIMSDYESAKELMNEAIEIWEKELKESKPKDKKARIGRSVTQAIILNLIQANIMTENYKEARNYCDKFDLLPYHKNRYKNHLEDLRSFMKDQKKRNTSPQNLLAAE
ncbi:MAG: hypothetical protein N4A49_02975 [Marinifilaceae bacterium]|jgi:hypothetical protein|nr:hypothetical protein [Marinifilaceae bacterium]